MQSWQEFYGFVSGDTPNAQPPADGFTLPDYSKTIRQITKDKDVLNIGRVTLTLVGETLEIDSKTHSVNLNLTTEQVQQLFLEFKS